MLSQSKCLPFLWKQRRPLLIRFQLELSKQGSGICVTGSTVVVFRQKPIIVSIPSYRWVAFVFVLPVASMCSSWQSNLMSGAAVSKVKPSSQLISVVEPVTLTVFIYDSEFGSKSTQSSEKKKRILNSIYPSSNPTLSNSGLWGSGAYPSCHRPRSRVNPGQLTTPSQDQHRDNHPCSHSLLLSS